MLHQHHSHCRLDGVTHRVGGQGVALQIRSATVLIEPSLRTVKQLVAQPSTLFANPSPMTRTSDMCTFWAASAQEELVRSPMSSWFKASAVTAGTPRLKWIAASV